MSVKDEEYVLVKCPLCKGEHRYIISIDKSPILYNIKPIDFSKLNTLTERRTVSMIFTCPKTNGKFKAEIEVEDSNLGDGTDIAARLV